MAEAAVKDAIATGERVHKDACGGVLGDGAASGLVKDLVDHDRWAWRGPVEDESQGAVTQGLVSGLGSGRICPRPNTCRA